MRDRHDRTVAEVSTATILRNLKVLSGLATESCEQFRGAVPMVKANAYGHGLVPVSKSLEKSRHTVALGVATLEEGITLRQAGIRKPIWVFSDCTPWSVGDDDLGAACVRFALTPVVHSVADLKALLHPRNRKYRKSLSVHLKFNTGMNRLGIDSCELSGVLRAVCHGELKVEGICSHLAVADDCNAPATRAQIEHFREVVGALSFLNCSYIHCSSTQAILWNRPTELDRLCNAVRPGIGIYGYGGRRGVIAGLKPALRWKARVVRSRLLSQGHTVGYGATCRVRKSTHQSVLSVGYGDGLHRALSNAKLLVGHDKRIRKTNVLGRVSMDLTAIELRSKPGDWVTLLGEGINQGDTIAESAGTIVYEILTSISQRVPRVYPRVY